MLAWPILSESGRCCLLHYYTLSDFGLLFFNCSSPRAEKDAVKYVNSMTDCFRTVGISRFRF